jgi:hypothetical protein
VEDFGIVLFLIVVGLGVIVFGGLVRIGWYKRWYLMDDDSIFFDKSAHYAFLPLGLSLILLGIMLLLPPLSKASSYALYGFFILGGLGATLFFWQPSWLKPSWIRWLEENNQDILDLIIEEGRKTKDWGKVVATQEGLEAWVAEVRRKHDRPAPVAAPGEVAVKPTPSPRPGRPTRPWPGWPVGLVVIAVSSGLGQYLLGNGLIGFIGGWVLLLVIYLLRPKE